MPPDLLLNALKYSIIFFIFLFSKNSNKASAEPHTVETFNFILLA